MILSVRFRDRRSARQFNALIWGAQRPNLQAAAVRWWKRPHHLRLSVTTLRACPTCLAEHRSAPRPRRQSAAGQQADASLESTSRRRASTIGALRALPAEVTFACSRTEPSLVLSRSRTSLCSASRAQVAPNDTNAFLVASAPRVESWLRTFCPSRLSVLVFSCDQASPRLFAVPPDECATCAAQALLALLYFRCLSALIVPLLA